MTVHGRPKVAPTTPLRLKLYVWHSRFCVGDGVLDAPLYAPSKLPANGMSGGHPLRITRTSFVERNKSFRLNVPLRHGWKYVHEVDTSIQHSSFSIQHFSHCSAPPAWWAAAGFSQTPRRASCGTTSAWPDGPWRSCPDPWW